jgi:predicted dehydrogenase
MKAILNHLSRRTFLKTSPITAAVASSPLFWPRPFLAASDRIRVAVLGVNGRGTDHISGFMGLENVEVATLCDPDANILAERSKEFESRYGKKVKAVQDLRRVFEDKDIDAVSIATPNHWHALATIWACQAGKDVYVEKPGAHNIREGRKMIEAAKKYNRIVQHGVQLRSSPAIQEAVRHLRSGLIGNVYMARGLVFRWRGDIGNKPNEPVPDYLNYDLWLGPAQERPFTRNLVHYNWHWHWDFGNGDVGNQGIHQTDMCLWGLGVGLPEKITALGGKFLWNDSKETPELLTSSYLYPKEKKIIEFEVRPWCTNAEDGATVGNIFYGSEGYMVIKGYGRYETFLGEKKEKGPTGEKEGNHYDNFIHAVRSRDKSILNGPVETAHLASSIAHLGNIAYRLGRVVEFDPTTERFKNDADADAMLTRQYRAPFTVPDEV